MKTKLSVSALLLSITLLLISCKKENINGNENLPVEKLQLIYARETGLPAGRDGQTIVPVWNRLQYLKDKQIYILPLQINKTSYNKSFDVNSYMVFGEEDKSRPGSVYTIVAKVGFADYVDYIEQSINGMASEKNSEVRVAKTSVENYFRNTGGNQTQGEVFVKKIQKTISQASPKNGETPTESFLPPEACNESTQVCIDWYWQTYENGVLTGEDYLYTTCNCTINSGGGGTTSPVDACTAQMLDFTSQGSATSLYVSTTIPYENSFGMNVVYNWKIFSAGSWGLLSYEDAVISKIPITGGGHIKEYSSFTHRLITAVGASYGGTRTFTDLGATINKTQTRVQVRIDYTVTSNLLGCPGGVTLPYNANKEFKITNNIVVAPPES